MANFVYIILGVVIIDVIILSCLKMIFKRKQGNIMNFFNT